MEALWYKAYGEQDQFWWDQYINAANKVGGENYINWGAEVSVPNHCDVEVENFETWRDRSPLL